MIPVYKILTLRASHRVGMTAGCDPMYNRYLARHLIHIFISQVASSATIIMFAGKILYSFGCMGTDLQLSVLLCTAKG